MATRTAIAANILKIKALPSTNGKAKKAKIPRIWSTKWKAKD